jgi:hypothetical protein
MKVGVVYKFKPKNKINGTLFYCFEYFKFLEKFCDCKFYITDISTKDLELVNKIFEEKYNTNLNNIIPIKTIDLYRLNLNKTLILDIHTFYNVKEFLTNEIHCFSNDEHEVFRYKNERKVIYYGSYNYQNYDVFSYLKLNFGIFKQFDKSGEAIFISALNQEYIKNELPRWKRTFPNKEIILKKNYEGRGNIFELIDSVHYVHTGRDTNNRIIPESFYYGKKITYENRHVETDSISFRTEDILKNGLKNYTLTEEDEVIKGMLL